MGIDNWRSGESEICSKCGRVIYDPDIEENGDWGVDGEYICILCE